MSAEQIGEVLRSLQPADLRILLGAELLIVLIKLPVYAVRRHEIAVLVEQGGVEY